MPYLTNAEEIELKRMQTTTDQGIFDDKDFLAAKGSRFSFNGYWGGQEVAGFGFEFVFSKAIVANSSPSNYWTV